jgi:sensor histidine kinase YesM
LILLSIPLALWVSRKLTSPIYRIVEGMRTVEKGDFNVRMDASSIQEYLHLTTHFNRMVHRLKALIGQLNQEHRDRREAEIQLLHAQIKPHFLYNTLDLIHWRALDYNAHEISRMVQQLSKLFRIGLSNDKWYVPVRDELAHARCYMAIQEYRQNFSIEYSENVRSDLMDVIIPKILLQPFLENAVIHGFQHRSDEKAVIQVGFDQREEAGERQLIITITDNGSGLPEGFDIQTTGGIGIRNVMDRIHLYCGPKYGVRVAPGERGGTQVIMKLPLIGHEAEMEQLTRSLSHEYDSLG